MKNALLIPGLLAAATVLTADPLKIELPAETGVFKPGKNVEIANGQCLVCHSVEYISTQPALPRAFWAGSVKKMREKYGASIPEEQIEPLLDYLTAHYGSGANAAPVATANSTPQTAPPRTATATASSIAIKYNCLGCHQVAAKVIGPAYKDIAAKYRTDTDAKKKIAAQLKQGGSGKWGPIIMPPFPQMTEEEISVLTDWILSRK